MNAYTAPVASASSQRKQVAPDFSSVASPVWSPDGQNILLLGVPLSTSDPKGEVAGGLWVIPRNGGRTEKVQIDPTRIIAPNAKNQSLKAWLPGDNVIGQAEVQGRTQLFKAQLTRNPWKLIRVEQLFSSGAGSAAHPSIARDGTMVFSNEDDDLDLWSLPFDADRGHAAGEPRRLTQDAAREGYPSISVDGAKLAYSAERANKSQIWTYDLRPAISADGSLIAYTSRKNADEWQTFVVTASGAAPRKVATSAFFVWDWSPDNRALLVFGPTRPASARMIALDPPSDVPFARRPHNVYQTHISHDGHWAAIQETGVGVLMAPVAGGKPHAPDSWKPLDLKRPI